MISSTELRWCSPMIPVSEPLRPSVPLTIQVWMCISRGEKTFLIRYDRLRSYVPSHHRDR